MYHSNALYYWPSLPGSLYNFCLNINIIPKVTIPALNDSKLIGICVYNVFILTAAGCAVSFALTGDPNALFLFVSGVVLLCTSITLGVVFVPRYEPVQNEDPKIFILKKKDLYFIIKLATKVLLYSLQISELDVLWRQNKILIFGHPFRSLWS